MTTVYPSPLKTRPELNLKQGIKSSIPEIKKLIGLTLGIYITNNQSIVDYGVSQGDKIIFSDQQAQLLKNAFSLQIQSTATTDEKFLQFLNSNPLLTAQIEALQVALELFLKLCKVSFPDGSSSSKERTGMKRYPKQLRFTTNAEIIHLCIDQIDLKPILFSWIADINHNDESDLLYNSKSVDKLNSLITIFGEETQFKIRKTDKSEFFFQQEGIYSKILQGHTVEDKDYIELVGPFRIFKGFVKTDLHPYIQSNNGFSSRAHAKWPDLDSYHKLVEAYLDVIPKRTTVTITSETFPEEKNTTYPSLPELSRNKILFGAPGTGKSSKIKNIYAKGHIARRVTFHPDYEYGSFVGTYKPVSVETETPGKKEIHYDYVPQEFTRIYCDAWNDPYRAYFLIIEEINRGNCAQIFGDIFQSLDRDELGFSEYDVDTDTDLAKYLKTFFREHETAASRLNEQLTKRNCPPDAYSKIILPNNLYLYATMNTSDQSLFPMDSAFKRRWDWEYIPIDLEPKAESGDSEPIRITIELPVGDYQWSAFLRQVNNRIYKAKESEDKQLGFWFVKAANGRISANDFIAKVLFYLWYEVFRNELEYSIFPTKDQVKEITPTIDDFHYGLLFDQQLGEPLLRKIMENVGIHPEPIRE